MRAVHHLPLVQVNSGSAHVQEACLFSHSPAVCNKLVFDLFNAQGAEHLHFSLCFSQPPALLSCRQKTTCMKTQCSACHGNRDNIYGGPYAGVICGNCLWTRFGGVLARILPALPLFVIVFCTRASSLHAQHCMCAQPACSHGCRRESE